MDNPTKARAIELAAEHERNIEAICEKRGLTRAQVTKALMVSTPTLPMNLLKELYYLDAYTRLINLENAEPEEWRAKEYLDAMMGPLYLWAEEADHLLPDLMELNEDGTQIDDHIFYTVLLCAVHRHNVINDRRRQNTGAPPVGEPGIIPGSST